MRAIAEVHAALKRVSSERFSEAHPASHTDRLRRGWLLAVGAEEDAQSTLQAKHHFAIGARSRFSEGGSTALSQG